LLRKYFEARPGRPSQRFEDVDGFFTSNYLFASRFVRNKVVLDVGCGWGYGTEFLIKKGAQQVIGVDVDDNVIHQCLKLRKTEVGLQFYVMSATALNFMDNTFDVVTAFEVIEHLDSESQKKFLNQVVRVLKKKGILLLSTPNKTRWSPNLKRPVLLDHKKEFYPDELRQLLNAYFKTVKILGKDSLNIDWIKNQRAFESSIKLRLMQLSSQFLIVRRLAKIIAIRHTLSKNSHPTTKKEAWTFSENIVDPYSLMAIAENY
jgi:ubiquinone/menaquinone biosynthesis C-methylase UbiE